MAEQWKVHYTTLSGTKSAAYIDPASCEGTNRYTDEDLTVKWDDALEEWFEVQS